MVNHFWIPCECGSEGLRIEKDDYDGDVYLALWHYGSQDMSIAHKLRWIWRIIKNKPFRDHIVIDESRLPEIIVALEGMKK